MTLVHTRQDVFGPYFSLGVVKKLTLPAGTESNFSHLTKWSSTRGTRKHLKSNKTKQTNRVNLEPALILKLTKIRPRIKVVILLYESI
jgi:hypothetical protein